MQVVALGLTFIALGLLSDGSYALVASYAAARWRRRGRDVTSVGERASGLVYLGLGLLAAVTPRHTSAHA